MTLKRNHTLRIGCVGLGLSCFFFILWILMNRLGFPRAPIDSNLKLDDYIQNIISNIGLYINVHLCCKFVTGSVRRFDAIAIVVYVLSSYPYTAFLGPEFQMIYTVLFPVALVLICAARKRQNIFLAAFWLAVINFITLALQLLLITVHVGAIPFLDTPVTDSINFAVSITICADQYLVLGFACAMKSRPPAKSSDRRLSDFLFPVAVDSPCKSGEEKSTAVRILQIGVVSAVCIVIGGFSTGASLILSYLAFAGVIKYRWQSENPVYHTVVYALVLGAATAVATFFYYPLLMPVICGLLANFFLYRLGLGYESAGKASADSEETLPAVACLSDETPERTGSSQQVPFDRDTLAAFSFEECSEPVLRYLVERSGINGLYAQLLIAKHCENLSGGEMEVRFQNVGVARTRQRHLQKARSEILAFRDRLLKEEKQTT